MLFTVPACFALVAEGAGRLTRSTDALPRALGLAAGALLLLPAAAGAIWRLFDPPRIQELRDVVAFVDEHLEPGDAVWVHREGVPAFRYYARRRGLPADLAIEPIVPGAPWPAFEERIEALPARSRVWTVFVSHELWGERNDERYIGRLLEKRGRFVGSIERPGASAHLFLTPPLP